MLSKCTPLFHFGLTLLALMMAMTLGASLIANGQSAQPPADQSVAGTTGSNLLSNPYFDNGGFYFRSPNSLVSFGWFRWDVTRPDGPNPIPEFIDGGSPYHNACYPEPPVGGLCADMTPRNHSQGYIKMGGSYIAGVWQPVQATPCMNYQFAGYVRTDAPGYRPRVGIDPTGWQMPPKNNPNPSLDYVCPPTGHSLCPRDHFSYESDMPATIVWSAPYAYDPPTPPIVWRGPLSVTTEALSTTITVWTYASPDEAGSQSTYWDYMSLVQVPPANGKLIAEGSLPAADGSITGLVTSTTALRANLSWQTSQAAVTQVLYHYVGDAAMLSPPPVATSTFAFESHTLVDSTASTTHSVRLPNLRPNSLYDYAILSRKLVGSACQTSALTGRLSTTDALLPNGPLPSPAGITGPIILPFSDFAYVIWQSAQPSYGQVLYHYDVYTPTVYPNHVFLPLVAAAASSYYGSTSDYEFRTPPDISLTTLHVITITSNLMPDSPYAAVAVSAWSDGDLDRAAASTRTAFQTQSAATLRAAQVGPDQLIEQLQACLADDKTLDVCVGELSR